MLFLNSLLIMNQVVTLLGARDWKIWLTSNTDRKHFVELQKSLDDSVAKWALGLMLSLSKLLQF